MFVDLRSLPEGEIIEADLCIVGAGACGLALALEFLDGASPTPVKTVLIESGGADGPDGAQALNAAVQTGRHTDLAYPRARRLGGGTNLWSGFSAPLDPIDFARRDWIPGSGWPVGPGELDPYWPRAARLLGLGGRSFDVEAAAAAEPAFARSRLACAGTPVREKLFQRRRLRLGEAWRDRLDDDGPVSVLLHGTAVALESAEGDGERRVVRVRTRTLDGRTHTVSAKRFVLAAGLENARLLLLSNDREPAGLGNRHDQVGRCFMGHLNLVSGEVALSDGTVFASHHDIDAWLDPFHPSPDDFSVALQLRPEVQESERTGNHVAFVADTYAGEWSPGNAGLRALLGDLADGRLPDDLGAAVAALSSDLDGAALGLFGGLTGGRWLRRRELHHIFEQAPNPDSRVTLAGDRDVMGQPMLRLDWRLSEPDLRTLETGRRQIGLALGMAGAGRVREPGDDEGGWPYSLRLTGEYMGTTRMAADPRRGVVDRDCRVHGTANLFVAGGSVMPTTGACASTIAMAALAIRLADHLKRSA